MGLGRKKGPGGGGGVGAVLSVTAPAGVTVSVSKDGKTKTKTANSEGLAVFTGLETGTWTLTITDGSQTSTKTVSVTADYSTVIAFFSATINITYPAGSTCTCSDGSTTLAAPDTSGTWACVVPNAGTWTVSCTDGSKSKSADVSIAADGQRKSVTLTYSLVIFDGTNGGDNTSVTGGWVRNPSTSGSTLNVSDTSVEFMSNSPGTSRRCSTVNAIDFTEYKTLYFDGVNEGGKDYNFALSTQNTSSSGGDVATVKQPRPDRGIVSIDLTGLSSRTALYVVIYSSSGDGSSFIYECWAE